MENQAGQSRSAGRTEYSVDPVKEQGILTSLTRKERAAAKLWNERWSFLSHAHVRQVHEEEALKLGLSLEQYHKGIRSLSSQLDPKKYPVKVDPSPHPIPQTSCGMVGRRALCPLERYGRLVKTARDYPVYPLPPPGQLYDPYKQTLMYIGFEVGDPISYKLPPATSEVTDDMWVQPRQLEVAALCDSLNKLLNS